MRAEHVKEMARMKFNFEEELQQQRNSENAKVEAIRKQADKVILLQIKIDSLILHFKFYIHILGSGTISL